MLWYGDTSKQTIDHLGQSIGSQWDCKHVIISAMTGVAEAYHIFWGGGGGAKPNKR